jgi:hypothetical protein
MNMRTSLIFIFCLLCFFAKAEQDSIKAVVVKAVKERNLTIEITHLEEVNDQRGTKHEIPKGFYFVLIDDTVRASLPWDLLGRREFDRGQFVRLEEQVRNYRQRERLRGRRQGFSIDFSTNAPTLPLRSAPSSLPQTVTSTSDRGSHSTITVATVSPAPSFEPTNFDISLNISFDGSVEINIRELNTRYFGEIRTVENSQKK